MLKAIFCSPARRITSSMFGFPTMANVWVRMMVTMVQSGQLMWTVSPFPYLWRRSTFLKNRLLAQSKFMVSGSADNTLKLWSVSTGKCLHTWEFPTAVKRVAFSDDDEQVVCITEQRMGYQGAIRVFNINREGEGKNREHDLST